MKDLVEYIVKQLVTNPEAVVIDEQNINGELLLTLTVDPDDMGLVIGKNGQTIKALRRILGVRAMADNVRVNLQLNDVGEQVTKEVSENEPKQVDADVPSD